MGVIRDSVPVVMGSSHLGLSSSRLTQLIPDELLRVGQFPQGKVALLAPGPTAQLSGVEVVQEGSGVF